MLSHFSYILPQPPPNCSFSAFKKQIKSESSFLLVFFLCPQVVAETAIKEDDPLLLCYGCLNNDFFLLDYGFVMHSNPYDCIELKYDGALLDAASTAAGVSSPNFSAPAPWQNLILSQLNLYGETPDLKVKLLLNVTLVPFFYLVEA